MDDTYTINSVHREIHGQVREVLVRISELPEAQRSTKESIETQSEAFRVYFARINNLYKDIKDEKIKAARLFSGQPNSLGGFGNIENVMIFNHVNLHDLLPKDFAVPIGFFGCHFLAGISLVIPPNDKMPLQNFTIMQSSGNVIELENVEFNHLTVQSSFKQAIITKIVCHNSTRILNVDEVLLIRGNCKFKDINIGIGFSSKVHIQDSVFGNCKLELSTVNASDETSIVNRAKEIIKIRGVFNITNCSVNGGFTCQKAIFNLPVIFDNTKFYGVANFSETAFNAYTSFENTEFHYAPKFHNATLHRDTEIYTAKFFDFRTKGAWRNYRTLKNIMEEFSSDHEAAKFHSYELQSRYHNVLKFKSLESFEKTMSFGMWALTGYGRALFRPILWL